MEILDPTTGYVQEVGPILYTLVLRQSHRGTDENHAEDGSWSGRQWRGNDQ